MTADIISLADRREAKVLHRATPLVLPPGFDIAAFRRAAARQGFEVDPLPSKRTTLERIQQIADNLGIDVEAPFRRPKGAPR